MTFLKNFTNWFNLKPKLDKAKHKPPLVSEGQIWWCYLGENIGSEISGKGNNFTRPGIIFKKLSHYTFLVVLVSSQINNPNGSPKEGSWFVKITQQGVENLAYLHQIRIIDYRRIQNFLGFLDESDFIRIQQGLLNLYFRAIREKIGNF